MTPQELEKWAEDLGFAHRHYGRWDLTDPTPWGVLRVTKQYWYMMIGGTKKISPQIEARCRDMHIFHKIDMGIPLSSQDKSHIKASLEGKVALEKK